MRDEALQDAENGASQAAQHNVSSSRPWWTDAIPRTAHNSLFLDCDFASTSLGPMSTWGQALRLYASMIFADSRGAGVYWGPDKIAFYNEKFGVCCGGAHPYLMGHGFKDAFPELGDTMDSVFDQAAATGQTADVDNMLILTERNGYLEEAYFIGQFIPLRGDSGQVEGFYNTVLESTTQVLSERRRKVVDRIAAVPPLPVPETLASCLDALRTNPHDITMALLYSFDQFAPESSSNIFLQGSIGIPEGHPSAPTTAHLETTHDGLIPLLRRVKISGKPLVLSETDGSIDEYRSVLNGVTWSGFGEPSKNIVVVPLTISGSILGFYVQGINPRRPYNDSMKTSVIDVVRQMEARWSASLSTQQSELRQRALEQRATDSENRLRHMAQSAPLGMVQVGLDERIQWANHQFYEITGQDRSGPADMSEFRKILAPEEREKDLMVFEQLANGSSRSVREIRLNRQWKSPMKEHEEQKVGSAWILALGFPLMENGQPKLIMGYVTDISHQKWAESVQESNANAAVLAKKRQEEFIDVTSHEMRNPLSAITQLADGIAKSLDGEILGDPEAWLEVAQDNVRSANTILACAAHQKRVIDDVLILGRLESQMLSITPVAAKPEQVVENTVKMFQTEIALNGIEIQIVQDDSYSNMHVDYVLVDTSRLTQILINLLSNAIKFTSTQAVRKIKLGFGAQARQPPYLNTAYGLLSWVSTSDSKSTDVSLQKTNVDERVYLYFFVQDTGPGLEEEGLRRLFKRFSQATSKTHVTYGGSGLGLYICKELAEKQGGGIGVASNAGQGSVFAIFIEARKAASPEKKQDHPTETVPRPATRVDVEVNSAPRSDPETGTLVQEKGDDTESSTPSQPRALTILLVEDNLVNQKVLAAQLRKARCTVEVANHGEEALAIIEKAGHWQASIADSPRTLDAVLMDVEMPVMDGLECTRRIRQLESQAQTARRMPVVAVTANVRQEQRTAVLAAGMDGMVSKPFTVSELLDRVREILRTIDEPS